MIKHRGETAELQRLDQIPGGITEAQVDGFWETHSLGDGILEQMEPFPDDFPLAPRSEGSDAGNAPLREQGRMFRENLLKATVAAGLLALSAYLIYRVLKGGIRTGDFLPTKAPYLKISQPSFGPVGASHLAGSLRALR